MHKHVLIGLVCALAATSAARADEITVSSSLTGGFWMGGYANSMASQNYFAGTTASSGGIMDRRNFFIFSLPGLAVPVTGATLLLNLPAVPGPEGGIITDGYITDDVSETYRLHGTPHSPMTVASPGLSMPLATDIWDSFGSGPSWGEASVTEAMIGADVAITLTPDAIASLNASLGSFWVLGGHIATLDGSSPDELIFGFSDHAAPHYVAPRLVLTFAPSPGAAAALGLWGAVAVRRGRRPAHAPINV